MSIYKGTEFIAGTPDMAGYAKNNNVIHISGDETLGGTKTFSNSPVVPTPAVNSNTNIPATTAYINVKFQVVSELPSEPDNNVFYFIPE